MTIQPTRHYATPAEAQHMRDVIDAEYDKHPNGPPPRHVIGPLLRRYAAHYCSTCRDHVDDCWCQP